MYLNMLARVLYMQFVLYHIVQIINAENVTISQMLQQSWYSSTNGANLLGNIIQDATSDPIAPAVVIHCNKKFWLDKFSFLHTSAFYYLQQNECNSSKVLRHILASHNTRKPLYFIIIADSNTIVQILQIANSIDLLLDQQGYYLDVYNWIFFNQGNSEDLLPYIENINHVVCVDLQTNIVKTAIWTHGYNAMRSWHNVTNFMEKIKQDTIYFPNSRNNFNGRTLRIGSQFWPGYFTSDTVNNSIIYSGMYERIIDHISKGLNFKYEIVVPLDGGWGYIRDDGTWGGLVGDLVDNKADFVIAPLTKNWQREQVIDFSEFFFQAVSSALVYRTPPPEGQALSMLAKPFSDNVWLYILISIFIYSAAATCMAILYGRLSLNHKSFEMNYRKTLTGYMVTSQNSFGSFLSQAVPKAESGSCRYVWGSWFIFSVIVSSLWSSAVISYLTVTTIPIPFSTVQEVSEQRSYAVGSLGGASILEALKHGTTESQRLLWKNIKSWYNKDPAVLSNDFLVHVNKVLTEKYIYVVDSVSIQFILEASECDLHTITLDTLSDDYYTIAMPKNSAYKDRMNKVTLALTEAGIVQRLLERYVYSQKPCVFQHSEYGAKNLTWSNIEDVYFAFYWCLVVCFGIFGLEILLYYLKIYAVRKIKL